MDVLTTMMMEAVMRWAVGIVPGVGKIDYRIWNLEVSGFLVCGKEKTRTCNSFRVSGFMTLSWEKRTQTVWNLNLEGKTTR